MYRTGTGPAKRRGGYRCNARPFRLRDDLQSPVALRGCECDLADELLDVEPLRVRLVADFQRRLPVSDPKTVDDAAEELAPMESARNHERNVGAGQLRLSQQRALAAVHLRRDAGTVGKLQHDRLPVGGDDHAELDEVG